MSNLSLVFREIGHYDEAERLAKECIVLREKKFGKDHGLVLGSKNNLAKIHVNQGRYEEAEKMLWQTFRERP
ncbi:hypothetical protein E8E11_010611 [Didymella keratinophila]|nr:hypothetical protein E8E11_010611 [Didymella keratinophila]